MNGVPWQRKVTSRPWYVHPCVLLPLMMAAILVIWKTQQLLSLSYIKGDHCQCEHPQPAIEKTASGLVTFPEFIEIKRGQVR